MTRTMPLLIACALGLCLQTGCASDASTARLLSQALSFGRAVPAPDPAFLALAESGAPRVIAAIDARPEQIALFVRQTVSDTTGEGTWLSLDKSQLILSDGILVGTRGFGGDVLASDVTQVAALVKSLSAGYATRLMTLIDGEDRAVTRAFKCQITPGAIDTVVIGTRPVSARTSTEQCFGQAASFENYYWVVPGSGEIIQSNQWAGQVTGKISLRSFPVNPE